MGIKTPLRTAAERIFTKSPENFDSQPVEVKCADQVVTLQMGKKAFDRKGSELPVVRITVSQKDGLPEPDTLGAEIGNLLREEKAGHDSLFGDGDWLHYHVPAENFQHLQAKYRGVGRGAPSAVAS
jgi:hypothetical protein